MIATSGSNMKDLFNNDVSNSISLQFNDENNNEIPIKNSSVRFEFGTMKYYEVRY